MGCHDVLDRPRESCGVVGLFISNVDVARTIFFSLYALQHRGQESAGIATVNGKFAYIHRGMGLVTQVFNEDNLSPLMGSIGIGHVRYSTQGVSQIRNAQPYLVETLHGPLGIAHNGNLINTSELRRDILSKGFGLSTSSDTEVILQMLICPTNNEHDENVWEARILEFMKRCQGAYSLVIMTRDAVYGVRDPIGFRPLCVGEVHDDNKNVVGHIIASESCALSTVGASYLREVKPGEVIKIDKNGLHSCFTLNSDQQALCIFEYVYFSRPDTILMNQSVHKVRQKLGVELALKDDVEADIVIGVPDSSTPVAIGYSQERSIPFTEGLIKNRYIGRTFIQPNNKLRKADVNLKYNSLKVNLNNKRVILIDDSIVRGNTMGPIVSLIREAGAAEVHVRIASAPIRFPCFMGIDMSSKKELIAAQMSVEEICNHVGADSLMYLSVEEMKKVVQGTERCDHCAACFSGKYPIAIGDQEKFEFEQIQGE